ncbi:MULTISPECIES: hypothetical protein [Candidatus Nitrosocaldus]|jgi:hypothetical protein|uniref:GRAM domain-containing protein n=1 Tax=Candidatus Nitrosocaldus cavascurensis TaxID=2058097 RepID=A0A2K5AQK8_9ARCH|nr:MULTISPECIES: hypothetical protein [Candidatus Nitrosocaldus]GBC74256.1 hypothetical protein HRbin05_00291 [archaeon HR05]SPC33897.1 GRAM domain-containing protein [Candidatus Nitrosocaldus cavascurensis]
MHDEGNVIMEEDCSEDKLGAGYLVLTDKSLVFYTGKAKVLTFSKDMKKALEVPLQDVKGTRTEGFIIKKLVVELKDGRVYKFGVLNNKKWKESIDGARAGTGIGAGVGQE